MESLFKVSEVPARAELVAPGAPQADYENTSYKFIRRDDTGHILGCVTDNYRLVTNDELYTLSSKAVEYNGGVFVGERVYGNGEKTRYKFRFPKEKVEVSKGDFVNPEVQIWNSYDGTTAVHLITGAFRMLCSNGMVIGSVFGKFNNRHSKYNANIDKLGETIPAMVTAAKQTAVEDMGFLSDVSIKGNDLLKVLELVPEQYMEQTVDYTIANKPETYWDLLNVATWCTTHLMNDEQLSKPKVESKIYPLIKRLANNASEVAEA